MKPIRLKIVALRFGTHLARDAFVAVLLAQQQQLRYQKKARVRVPAGSSLTVTISPTSAYKTMSDDDDVVSLHSILALQSPAPRITPAAKAGKRRRLKNVVNEMGILPPAAPPGKTREQKARWSSEREQQGEREREREELDVRQGVCVGRGQPMGGRGRDAKTLTGAG